MDENEFPAEPLSQLTEAAAQMHEMFLSLQVGGFTRQEALQIITGIMSEIVIRAGEAGSE